MNDFTLFQISNEMNTIFEQGFTERCINEDGEIDQSKVDEYLQELNVSFDTKVDNIVSYVKNLSVLVNALKEQEKTLAERRKAKEKKIESLKSYLSDALAVAGRDRFENAKHAVSFRNSQSVKVYDEELLPTQYVITKLEKKPDLAAIKKAIKAGDEVGGAIVETHRNIQIK